MKERKMWNNLCREKRAQEGQKGPNFFLLSLLLSLLKKWSEIHHVPGEKTCRNLGFQCWLQIFKLEAFYFYNVSRWRFFLQRDYNV